MSLGGLSLPRHGGPRELPPGHSLRHDALQELLDAGPLPAEPAGDLLAAAHHRDRPRHRHGGAQEAGGRHEPAGGAEYEAARHRQAPAGAVHRSHGGRRASIPSGAATPGVGEKGERASGKEPGPACGSLSL